MYYQPRQQVIQILINLYKSVVGSDSKRITQKSLQDAQHPQRLFLCLVRGIGQPTSGDFRSENAS